MPLYPIECKTCNYITETLCSYEERVNGNYIHCDQCHQPMEFLITTPGMFDFKGSGFYETDWKHKK